MRTERVASLIREEVGMLFSREFRDPQYGFITVTEVRMSPDLRIAKIYVSILGKEEVKQRTFKMLEDRKSQVRSLVGSHVRIKFTPSIQFYLDDTLEHVEKINRLIKEIHKNDERKGE
jgi:ribosome-binding factor A